MSNEAIEAKETIPTEKTHRGFLFAPPEKVRNTLIIRGTKTKYVYAFVPGAKTLVHEKDVKGFEKQNYKKED